QLIALANRQRHEIFRVDCLHNSAGIDCAAENLEAARSKVVAKIDKLHSEAAIGLIAAESADRFAIRHAIEWRLDVYVARCLENRGEHSFREFENVIWCDERAFDVDLRELGLPIGAQILIPKTFRDLKILFHAGDLEELLVLLGRLRQRIKF